MYLRSNAHVCYASRCIRLGCLKGLSDHSVSSPAVLVFPARNIPNRIKGEVMKHRTIGHSARAFLLCLSALLCGLGSPLPAQNQSGSISGTLTDQGSAVLRGAEISIPSNGMLVSTDQQGRFFFSGLQPGSYTISVSYIGFQKLTKTVTVTAGESTTVNMQLQVASGNETVLVSAASASAEVEAVNEERSADNILQVMPVQTITSLPSSNLGNAIGRLPSVSLTRNEGEDQFVQVRGTEPRLNNTTIDGFNMPSEDAGTREFDFSAIPAGIVDSIEVSKTLQANMDGDGVGGSVNLITKTASDTPTYQISVLGGFTPIENGRPNIDTYGTWGRRFGASKKVGFIIGGEYTYEGTGINDTEPTPDEATLSNNKTVPWFDAQDIRTYEFHRPRWGVAGSLDFRLKPGSAIFLRSTTPRQASNYCFRGTVDAAVLPPLTGRPPGPAIRLRVSTTRLRMPCFIRVTFSSVARTCSTIRGIRGAPLSGRAFMAMSLSTAPTSLIPSPPVRASSTKARPRTPTCRSGARHALMRSTAPRTTCSPRRSVNRATTSRSTSGLRVRAHSASTWAAKTTPSSTARSSAACTSTPIRITRTPSPSAMSQ